MLDFKKLDIAKLAESMTVENAEPTVGALWEELRRRYLVSAITHGILNFVQLLLAGSIVAFNVYVTRYANYQTELFVAIAILMSVVTFVSSLSLFLALRARARRNKIRYILAQREATLYKKEQGIYANPKTRDERIVQQMQKIRA